MKIAMEQSAIDLNCSVDDFVNKGNTVVISKILGDKKMFEQKNIGILLFNEVEVLDFAGPFEVFSITTYTECNEKPFKLHF